MAAASRTAALNLYRRWLRAVSRFPERRLRDKLRYNVREVFELYRHEKNRIKVKDVIEGGEEDLVAFSQIQKLDSDSLQALMSSGRTTSQSSKQPSVSSEQ